MMAAMPTQILKAKRNRTGDNFLRCINSLLNKSNNLTKYQADVYVLIRRNGKLWEYNSLHCDCWPLPSSAIVGITASGKGSD
jgi:hypothetical protein